MMENIMCNNGNYNYWGKEMGLNVMGNNNKFQIRNCKLNQVSITGNNNLIIIKQSQMNANLIGNSNEFQLLNCSGKISIVGNNNKIAQKHTNLNISFRGNSNKLIAQLSSGNVYIDGFNNQVDKKQSTIEQHIEKNNNNNWNSNNFQNYSYNNGQSFSQINGQFQQSNFQFPPIFPFNQNTQQNGVRTQNNQYQTNYDNQLLPRRRVNNNQNFHNNNNFHREQQINIGPPILLQQMVEGDGLGQKQINMLSKHIHTNQIPSKCTICLLDISKNNQVTYLVCFHSFHSKCIINWLRKNSKCPICQTDMKEQMKKIHQMNY